jgi:3-hydroxymyristoyl/3-hydroxydecanoyl-(acyl carrier protein) dehydratase
MGDEINMLVRILSASFRQWVKHGKYLELHATIVSDDERFATADCQASVDGRAVAQAKLFFSFVPLESFAAGFKDQILEDFMAGSVR